MSWMLKHNAVDMPECRSPYQAAFLRKVRLLQSITLALAAISLSARAADFYAGIGIAPIVYWQQYPPNSYTCCSPYSTEQDSSSIGFGVHAGQRVWDVADGKVGWEVGYANLGSINGSTTYTSRIPSTTGNWRYTATAVYVAVTGTGIFGNFRILTRAGGYKSTVQAEGSYATGSGSYSVEASGAGFLLGVGYAQQLTRRLYWLINADGFLSMKLVDPASPTSTISQSILKLSLGLEYAF